MVKVIHAPLGMGTADAHRQHQNHQNYPQGLFQSGATQAYSTNTSGILQAQISSFNLSTTNTTSADEDELRLAQSISGHSSVLTTPQRHNHQNVISDESKHFDSGEDSMNGRGNHYLDHYSNNSTNQDDLLEFTSQAESNLLDMFDPLVQNCTTWADSTFNTSANCSNETFYYYPEAVHPIEFSLTFQVIIYILYNTVFIAAVLGNVLVCYVVFSSSRMRTVTNYLIVNLAVGDLLMAVLCVPFSYISVLLQYWPFGQFLCYVVSPAQAVCVFVSAYTLVVLAGDRYVAILYPLKPRLRKSQAFIVIAMVWFIAIITATPIAVFTRLIIDESELPRCQEDGWSDDRYKLAYSLTLMILQYFFPLGVLVFTYSRIAIEVWGKKAPGEAEDGRDQRLAKAKRKTVVMSLAVVAGYTLAWLPLNLFLLLSDLGLGGIETVDPYLPYIFFCIHWMIKMMLMVMIVYTLSWLPFNILIIYTDLYPSAWRWSKIPYMYTLIHWMAVSQTVLNPIIYCWMNSRFREGFIITLARAKFLRKCRIFTNTRFPCNRRNTNTNNNIGELKWCGLSIINRPHSFRTGRRKRIMTLTTSVRTSIDRNDKIMVTAQIINSVAGGNQDLHCGTNQHNGEGIVPANNVNSSAKCNNHVECQTGNVSRIVARVVSSFRRYFSSQNATNEI